MQKQKNNLMFIHSWKTITVFLLSFLLSACPQPFDPAVLTVLQDTHPPEITINSPADGSRFESAVTVTGTIIDRDEVGNLRQDTDGSHIAQAGYDVVALGRVKTFQVRRKEIIS